MFPLFLRARRIRNPGLRPTPPRRLLRSSAVGTSGPQCRECFLAELEEAIAEEHPELKRGDVFELVQEWLRLEDDRKH